MFVICFESCLYDDRQEVATPQDFGVLEQTFETVEEARSFIINHQIPELQAYTIDEDDEDMFDFDITESPDGREFTIESYCAGEQLAIDRYKIEVIGG